MAVGRVLAGLALERHLGAARGLSRRPRPPKKRPERFSRGVRAWCILRVHHRFCHHSTLRFLVGGCCASPGGHEHLPAGRREHSAGLGGLACGELPELGLLRRACKGPAGRVMSLLHSLTADPSLTHSAIFKLW